MRSLTSAAHVNGHNGIASSEQGGLELKIYGVHWAAIGEFFEGPAQPHAPHVPATFVDGSHA